MELSSYELSTSHLHYLLLYVEQIENLLDDQDFKAKVTREEFESMCSDLFERIGKVVQDALKTSEMTMV